MLRKFLFILISLVYSTSFGQNTKQLDNLLRKLETQKEDTAKLNGLMQIQSLFSENQSNKKLIYLEKALQLAKKLKKPEKEVQINLDLGTYYSFKSDFEKSLKYHLECAKIAEKINNKGFQIKGYLGVGQAFQHLDNHSSKAKIYYQKAEYIAIASKDSSMLSEIYLQIGFLHYYKSQFDSTLLYYSKSLELANKKKDLKLIGNIYNEIGLAFSQQKKTDLALKNFDLAIEKYNKLPQKPLLELSYVHSDIGFTYLDSKNYEKALAAFTTSLDYTKQAQNPETEMENYQFLADLYEQKGDYKLQSQFLKKYYSLKDSMFKNDSKLKFVELENDYQLEQKNLLIAKQEAEATESKNQRNILLIIVFSTSIFAVILTYFYRRIQAKNKQINQQKEELQQLNQVKDRLFAILSHDLRNPLTTLKTYFSMLLMPNLSSEKKEKYTSQTIQAVNQTSELLDNLLLWANSQLKISTVKMSSVNLNDSIDDVIALVNPQAIQKQIIIEKNIEVESIISNQQIIETILRNLLTNAIKFSHSKGKIVVSSYIKNEQIFICVSDNGIGMNLEKIQSIYEYDTSKSIGTSGEKGSGIGLVLVRELVKQIGAELMIESVEGTGSTFMIIFK